MKALILLWALCFGGVFGMSAALLGSKPIVAICIGALPACAVLWFVASGARR